MEYSMADGVVTVEQAAKELNMHPKTVLRYIRDGRLPATRIGKSYRIPRAKLDAFAGIANGKAGTGSAVRATCIVEIPNFSADKAERTAAFLHSAALAGNSDTPPLRLQTAFDPSGAAMKVVIFGTPADVGRLLDMLQLQVSARP